jgi:hypothetical protein
MMRRVSFGVIALTLLGLTQGSSAAPVVFAANLSGAIEAPPNASPGSGRTVVVVDLDAHTLQVSATFRGLLGPTTAAHIHGPTDDPFPGNIGQTAGVATQVPSFALFPLGVTEGSFDQILDMTLDSSYNPSFLAANGGTAASAEAALAAAIFEGRAYLNIHTEFARGGEIRGFLQPVPEPATVGLAGMGAISLAGYAWRRRRRQAGSVA